MADSLRVLGLTFYARHGVRPEELTMAQPFEVDVEVNRDLSHAAKTDKLEDTVNYSDIVTIVKEIINGSQCRLIEKLAGSILDRICGIISEGEVVVRVRKPRAPISTYFRTIEVELRREVKR
jgi:7,8-dihydroneopterin aldolase/epimerase/oxygenase